MKSRLIITLLCLMPLLSSAQSWTSDTHQTTVIELFPSEGCSSCPPADAWLSSLKGRPGLFTDFIPLAYHVDYWDRLGWKDRLARSAYSQRQRRYGAEGVLNAVYTPGFVINHREWRGWFNGEREWQAASARPGKLQVTLEGEQITARFDGHQRGQQLHAAYLGMGLSTRVRAGENHGRQLQHDFAVLKHWRVDAGPLPWRGERPAVPQKGQGRTALVIWVKAAGEQRIVQATGGFLD